MTLKTAGRIDDLIGDTPLLDVTEAVGAQATIMAKFEAMNPGGSIKDRIAKAIIDDAEEKGALKPGATIIEPTSGNTGVGLAMIAAARGYKFIAVMPETMSMERRKLIAAFGAQLVLTPGSEGMTGSVAQAEELLAATPGSFGPHQFDNPINPQAHYETTGPEIWEQTAGSVDAFVAGVGTGGTLSGTGRFLRQKNAGVHIAAVEPEESQVLAGKPAGAHKIQGIAPGFIAKTLDTQIYDEVIPISSATAFEYQKLLSTRAGVFAGISSGAAVAAAKALADRPEFAGKTIVAILPDTGERYLSMLSD